MARCWDKRAALHLKCTEQLQKSPSLFVALRALSCRARSDGAAPSRSTSSLQSALSKSLERQVPTWLRLPLPLLCVCAHVGGSGTLPEWTVKWVRHLTACYASHQQHHSDAKRSGRDPFAALCAKARQPRAQQRS
ncbi:hypothetical protein IG631_15496 [Alternaria alternata]|nr:hypothetical protein IG631_15496 [Alternaria alternata]